MEKSLLVHFEHILSAVTAYHELNEPFLIAKEDVAQFIEGLFTIEGEGDYALNFHYKLPLEVKKYLIYLRDAALQFQLANIKELQGVISQSEFTSFKASLVESLHKVTEEVKTEMTAILQMQLSEKEREQYSEITSPLKTYKEQCIKLNDQIEVINQAQHDLKASIPKVNKIRGLLNQEVEELRTSFEYLEKVVSSLVTFTQKGEVDSKEVVKSFNNSNAEIQQMFLTKSNIDFELDQVLDELLDEIKIPKKSDVGLLKIRPLRFKESIKEWLRLEVLPEIYEARELNDEMINAIKASAGNMHNRIKIAYESGESSFNTSVFQSSLKGLQMRHEQLHKDASAFLIRIEQEVNAKLSVDGFFNNEDIFVSTNWIFTMDSAAFEEAPIVKSLKKWGSSLQTQVKGILDSILDKHQVNISELLIEYVKSMSLDMHSPYNNIFLTKSFSGKSFYVKRPSKHKLAHNSILNWVDGFRGSLLVTGVRYSGKSSFIDAVLDEHRDFEVLNLSPSSDVNYAGRKFVATNNLGDQLAQLKNHYSGNKTIIAVDDIMDWGHKDVSLVENMYALTHFINNNGGKFYIIAGISELPLRVFNPQLQLTTVFNTVIDLSHARLEEVYRIIDIRHGSTHKQLTGKEDQVVSPEVFRKHVKHVYKEAEGVVGDILNLWALGINIIDEEMVNFKAVDRKVLPDFITEENSVILKALATYKRLNEYQLRNLIGPAFNNKYKNILNRLMGVGLIYREGPSNLALNDMLHNQIADKLKCEDYI